MKCPRCEGELKSQEWSGIEVDKCAKCGGTWFDKGEFDSIQDDMSQGEIEALDTSPVENEFSKKQEGELVCPKCEVQMDSFLFQYSSGIRLDRCNICDGFWFDCGEIGAALGYMEAQESGDLSDEEVKALLDKGRQEAKANEAKSMNGLAENKAVKGVYKLMYKLGRFTNKFNFDIVS